VKIEFKRNVNPLNVNELINQDYPLFIGEFFGREARYEHDEVCDRVDYVEKHFDPLDLIELSICGGCCPPCSSLVCGCGLATNIATLIGGFAGSGGNLVKGH
jgi:hypothetical protein